MGIALDNDVNVYVSDEYLHRITVFNQDGDYLNHWGVHGSGDGELDRPAGLAVRDNVLYVVDSETTVCRSLPWTESTWASLAAWATAPAN